MTDTEANQAVVEPTLDEATPTPPEPWTPARVSEWNAYYDVYVAAFVLALAFLGSSNTIQSANSGLWSLLATGRAISEARSPIGIEGSTTVAVGQRWVNIPWLYEVIHYQLFHNVAALAPPPVPAAAPAVGPLVVSGEQAGAGALIALDALVRAITAWLLLGLRRKGPGLWWTAICVTLALGVSLSPEPVEQILPANDAGGTARIVKSTALGIQIGGLAGTATVAPETWGLMLLAIELLLLHQANSLGKRNRLYALIPLFLVWANMDETFVFGLLILAGATVGRFWEASRTVGPDLSQPPAQSMGFVLLACSLATLVNPAHFFGVIGSFGTLIRLLPSWLLGLLPAALVPSAPEPISAFGSTFFSVYGSGFAWSFRIYMIALIGLGLISFALNYRRFSAGRLLMFVVAALVWVLALIYNAPFAAVLVAVLALNGQEWYHDTIGTEGRLGGGWTFWSTGGRLASIAVIFVAIFQATTGWGGQVGGPRFGFGFDPDDFPFEASEVISKAPLEGNVLNTTLGQGDVLSWRTAGKLKAFIDSKPHLYTPANLTQFEEVRKAIRDDKIEVWQPILDQAKISSVMIQITGPASSPVTYRKLLSNKNWVAFHDDGSVALFGRADATALPKDVAYFKENQLDAEAMAFKRPKPVPAWLGAPRAVVESIDRIFQNRLLKRTQPHVEAAQHWLRPATVPDGTSYLPDPAHCLLAIRELRTALSSKPDDYAAYRLLAEAYRLLLTEESGLIAGIMPTQENIARMTQAPAQPRLLANRSRQLLTALNFAAMTLPPARTAEDRVARADLNFGLAQLNIQSGAYDLARERLLAIDGRPAELSEEFFKNQVKLLGDLNKAIEQVQNRLGELTTKQMLVPKDKADFYRGNGVPGLAIQELEDAEGAGGQGGIRPILVDLYSDTGQPEKALDLISTLNADDPTLSTGVGTATHRQGLIYLLLGDYRSAVSLWSERSISQIRNQRLMQAPMAAQALMRGEPIAATRLFVELPERVDQQAEWEFELAMAALEGGQPPEFVVEHFRSALELEPNLTVRPLIAYYLEKLGASVPPKPSPPTASAPSIADKPENPAPVTTPPAEGPPTTPTPPPPDTPKP